VRTFSPAFYADILSGMGVSTVVRLNEPRYTEETLTSQGFAYFGLEFPDCTCPPDNVVADFLRIVDAATGVVAVHCHAGLGRTGTLIALYLMLSCGFTAREAMGWLRIMRPGSVIGEQQHYLSAVDAALNATRRRARGKGTADSRVDRPAVFARSEQA
jgi:cell division cycle 14